MSWPCRPAGSNAGSRRRSHRASALAPANRDGVCANVEFPFPGRVVSEALALAGGIEPERDPWLPARLVWPLIEVVESAAQEDWLDPLTRHLRSGSDQRYSRLAQVARLFDEYSVRRPELIQAWARGETGGVDEGRAAGWQPELWRRLRAHVESAESRRAARSRLRATGVRAPRRGRCRHALPCSGSRACRPATCRSWRRWRAAATCT